MPTIEGIRWFKQQFGAEINARVQGTPYTLDMLAGIACQETGYIWNRVRTRLDRAGVLRLCVGDTLDTPNRSAFPKNKAELLGKPNGQAMFDIARAALVEVAQYVPDYKGPAAKPDKFCRGFGIFQYDLQFFLTDPQYFLQRQYADFGACLSRALRELASKQKRIGWEGKKTLTDIEMACVAIAYNTGGFKPEKGLKQGYKVGDKYYGEAVLEYITRSKTVTV